MKLPAKPIRNAFVIICLLGVAYVGITIADIEQYVKIYEQTLKRWGEGATAAYPRELFLNLYRRQDPGVAFWIAEVDGTATAGALVLAWNKNMVYWHGCALEQYFKHYPNNLLHATIIQWGCENGFEHYDMGASMDMEGVVKFKESFGAHPVPFKSYRWK